VLRISLGQFRVGSHRLRVETDHHLDRSERTCLLCSLQEVETEEHFIFRCPVYYEIRGRFHCLFRELPSFTTFFKYYDQRCLALYLQEALRLRDRLLHPPPRRMNTRLITSFFPVLSPMRGTKRHLDTILDPQFRSVKSRDSISSTRGPLPQAHLRAPSHRQRSTRLTERHRLPPGHRLPRHSTVSATGYRRITSHFHPALSA
ncbi:hypothetical protein KI387_040957, partial [Taxus chinensis]